MPAHLIDAHCHLDFDVFNDDRTQVLQRAFDKNVNDIIIPGTEKAYWERVTLLCNKHEQLHACYGLHPYWADIHDKKDIAALERYIDINTTIAIGECGLDFRTQQADEKTQLYFFEAQLAIAENFRLPVIIHSVRATETVIATIKKYKNLTGMIHSYSGSFEQAKQLIDLNFLISVSGSATYDNAKKIKNVIRKTPFTSLLVETDAPDQVDKYNTGKRNEPAFLLNTIKTIAELKQVSETQTAEQTTANARKLFKI